MGAGDIYNNQVSDDGTTTVIRATANTTWTAYPVTVTTNILTAIVESDTDNSGGRRIWVSLDNLGTNYTSLSPGDSLQLTLKSRQQIYIRTASSTATFSMWVNREL